MRQLTPEEEDAYWGRIAVDYEAYYAYEEVLAAFGDLPRQASSMLAKMEAVAEYLNGGPLDRTETIDEIRKTEGLDAFTRRSAKDYEQELAWLGDEYESIRNRMEPSDSRTGLLTLLVGRAQTLGAYRDAGVMAEALFTRETDGDRIVGLALARIDPQRQHIDLACPASERCGRPSSSITRSCLRRHCFLYLTLPRQPSFGPRSAPNWVPRSGRTIRIVGRWRSASLRSSAH